MNIDNEYNNIYRVINNTKNKKIRTILIIDEAHQYLNNKKDHSLAKKELLIKEIDPYKIIKISATLSHYNIKPDFTISYNDVRSECAIKKNIWINHSINLENINNKSLNEHYNEDQQLIFKALNKQKEIKQIFFKKNILLTPLILIQIPNDNKTLKLENELIKNIEVVLNDFGFKKGINYAFWLDNNKTKISKHEIEDINSNIEVLIFKQAIATGWDIPRSNILVRLRDSTHKGFNIQTIGRILRNPFFKYYENPLIDDAFVYTKDEKYINELEKVEISLNDQTLKEVERSKIAKINQINNKNNIQINKLIFKNQNVDSNKIIDYIIFQIFDKHLKDLQNNYLKINKSKIIIEDAMFSSNILNKEENDVKKELNKFQTKFDMNQQPEKLFDIYLKYKTLVYKNKFINDVLDKLSLKLSNENICKIKHFYLSTINNYLEPIFDKKNIKELIIFYRDEYINKTNKYQTKLYTLPLKYNANSNYVNFNKWDDISAFDFSLKEDKLDSENEKQLYKYFISHFRNYGENIYLFRNGTNVTQDYYIEYISEENKILKFFPDWLFVNNLKNEIYIVESKGINQNDIDKNTNLKLKAINDNLSLINDNKNQYKVSFICLSTFKDKILSYLKLNKDNKYNNINLDDYLVNENKKS